MQGRAVIINISSVCDESLKYSYEALLIFIYLLKRLLIKAQSPSFRRKHETAFHAHPFESVIETVSIAVFL